ncbi:MAG: transporter [Nitrospira sp. LK265]|nr:BON domain-containing protein [Nitrospira sp.]NGZ59145.1 transporter [Nitrospira sp. LK265]
MLSLVFVLLALVLNGVSELIAGEAATARTDLERLNDDSITANVEGKLASANVIDFARVDVETERGTVVLSGTVPTSQQKARAEQLAREVGGVKQVTNKLQVRVPQQP